MRGGLIDLFPMGSPVPYRVDLFDDEIDSIRTFDPDIAAQPLPGARGAPAARPRVPARRGRAHRLPRALAREVRGRPDQARASTRTSAPASPPPASSTTCRCSSSRPATLFDYLGADAALVLHGEVDEALERFWTDTRERHRFLQHDPERPMLPPEELFLRAEDFFALTQPHATLALRGGDGAVDWARPLPDRRRRPRRARAAGARCSGTSTRTPHRVLLVAESAGRRESLLELLRDHRIERAQRRPRWPSSRPATSRLAIAAAPLAAGFVWHEPTTARRSSSSPRPSSSPPRRSARRRRKQEQVSNVDALIKDLSELKIGDPVVHDKHGIGRYLGLITMDLGRRRPTEFLHLEYADKATLYVPVAQLHLIAATPASAPTRRRCTSSARGQWEKAKRKAAEQVRDTAAELLNLYARRAAREGHAFRFTAARLRGLRRRLRLRGDARPAAPRSTR